MKVASFPTVGEKPSAPGAAEIVLAIVAVGMMAYRLANPGLAAFINDEPLVLQTAEAHLKASEWAGAGLQGTQGVPYGPVGQWFFHAVHLIAGPAPGTSILAVTLLMSLAQVGLAWALARLFKGGLPLFALLTAFMAASPYHFMWSRLAWEFGASVFTCAAVALFSSRGPMDSVRGFALGMALGLGFGSHLMVVPFVALVGLVLFLEMLWQRAILVKVGVSVLGGFVGVNLSYLRALWGAPGAPPTPFSFTLDRAKEALLAPARVASLWRVEYFFDSDWGALRVWLGRAAQALDVSFGAVLLLSAVAAVGLLLSVGSPEPARRRVAWLGLLVWGGYALFYGGLSSVDVAHPHYAWATWWVIGAGLASMFGWLREKWAPGAVLAGVVAGALCLAQFGFIVSWMGFIRERTGTRGIHYSTPLAEQQRIIQQVCASPERALMVQHATLLFSRSLEYVAYAEPACANKTVLVCGQGACPMPGAGVRTFRLGYAQPAGGALALF